MSDWPYTRGLYAITVAELAEDDTRLLQLVQAALEGGVRLIQYRDKQADAVKALRQARLLVSLCEDYGALLLVNDNVALAKASKAHGVHLGQQDGCLRDARRYLGVHSIIGRTCHNSLLLAEQAALDGADYLAFGRCFSSHTKPDAPATSLDIFARTAHLGLPRVAIGGITPENSQQVLAAGADMIAAAQGIFGAPDPIRAVQDYLIRFTTSHPLTPAICEA